VILAMSTAAAAATITAAKMIMVYGLAKIMRCLNYSAAK
jgi:hypothetical protein